MPLYIRNAETEQLAEALARLTGETKTRAVTVALRDRLNRLRRDRSGRSFAQALEEIADQCSSLPGLDTRDADEILGYGETGEPS